MVVEKSFFKILRKIKNARLGRVETSRGPIDTPAFMPVGTAATVKGYFAGGSAKKRVHRFLPCNTYHLMLRPSAELIANFGGFGNKFMN